MKILVLLVGLVLNVSVFAQGLPADAGDKFRNFLKEFFDATSIENSMNMSNFQKSHFIDLFNEFDDLPARIANGENLNDVIPSNHPAVKMLEQEQLYNKNVYFKGNTIDDFVKDLLKVRSDNI